MTVVANIVPMLGWANLLALSWFLLLWISYNQFAKYRAKVSASLSSVLHVHRINWMTRMLQRDVRVADAALLGNLERNVTFFASSCVLIIAGMITAITASEDFRGLINAVNLARYTDVAELELKFVTLLGIFIYAFFAFTWSMRQYGFSAVLVGAAPAPDDDQITASERRGFATYAAKVIDQAGHSYNSGLRSMYYSMAALSWFISPWIFMFASLVVTAILYRREFHSRSLDALKLIENVEVKIFQNEGSGGRNPTAR